MALTKVITWEAPNGDLISVCKKHEKQLTNRRQWPKNKHGEEYCSVYEGLHKGRCFFCDWCHELFHGKEY